MRDKRTSSQGVRIATRKITRCLLYEASKNLPLVNQEVTTPLTTFTAKVIDPDIKIIISATGLSKEEIEKKKKELE